MYAFLCMPVKTSLEIDSPGYARVVDIRNVYCHGATSDIFGLTVKSPYVFDVLSAESGVNSSKSQ